MTIQFTIEETKEIIRQHLLRIFPEDCGMEFEVHIFLDEEKEITIEASQID